MCLHVALGAMFCVATLAIELAATVIVVSTAFEAQTHISFILTCRTGSYCETIGLVDGRNGRN